MTVVRGRCPMCGTGLVLDDDGRVRCVATREFRCSNPYAASDLLEDVKIDHVVEVTDDGWTIEHPLRERLDGSLFDCALHRRIDTHGVPVPAGRYDVADLGYGAYTWRRI